MLETYRRILAILEPEERRTWRRLTAMSVGLGLLEAAGVLSILPFLAVAADPTLVTRPGPLKTLYDFTGFTNPATFQIVLGAGVFVLLVGGIGFRLVTFFLQTRFARAQATRLSLRLLERYLRQPYAWFLQQHSARLGKGVLYEVEQVVNNSVISSMHLIAYGAVATAVLAVLVAADPSAALVVGGLLGFAYGSVLVAMRRRLQRLGAERVAANAERFGLVQEALGGIKEVKLRHLEETFVDRFRRPAERVAETRAKIAIISEAPRSLLEALVFGAMILFILWALIGRDGDVLSAIPVIGLYAFAGIRLFPVLQRLYRAYALIRADGTALEALHAELAGLPPAEHPDDTARLPLRSRLDLHDVHYTFPEADRPALDGVSLSIPARASIGFVGTTGAGKTTLADVILGLLRIDSGEIRVDGVALDDSNLAAWQRSVGYVPQSIYLLDDTILANIAFGIETDRIDIQAAARAAKAAGLHDFVSGLPEGYQTIVGERGVRLSGGQRQRVGIARALYHDPDVLVFDEATSALDNVTERLVLDALTAVSSDKTVLIVAHRLTTVRRCDQIYLMAAGRIVDHGTYADLQSRNSSFRALHEAAG